MMLGLKALVKLRQDWFRVYYNFECWPTYSRQ